MFIPGQGLRKECAQLLHTIHIGHNRSWSPYLRFMWSVERLSSRWHLSSTLLLQLLFLCLSSELCLSLSVSLFPCLSFEFSFFMESCSCLSLQHWRRHMHGRCLNCTLVLVDDSVHTDERCSRSSDRRRRRVKNVIKRDLGHGPHFHVLINSAAANGCEVGLPLPMSSEGPNPDTEHNDHSHRRREDDQRRLDDRQPSNAVLRSVGSRGEAGAAEQRPLTVIGTDRCF